MGNGEDKSLALAPGSAHIYPDNKLLSSNQLMQVEVAYMCSQKSEPLWFVSTDVID